MKRALSFLLSLALLFSGFAHADLRATNGGFGPIAATSGSISTAVTGLPTLLSASFAAVSVPADITEDTLVTVTVPANTLGALGILRITTFWSFVNNADTKTMRVRYSGGSGTAYFQVNGTTQQFYTVTTLIGNRNATNSQGGNSIFVNAAAAASLQSTAMVTSAVDTTASTTIVITGQKSVAGDAFTLEGYMVEVIH